MKIDGKAIADRILKEVSEKVVQLKTRGVMPTLAVIQVGDNEESTTYINQKKKVAVRIGARVVHAHYPPDVSRDELKEKIDRFNDDSSIHGVILQRPLSHVSMYRYIDIKKDVDGFLENSPYTTPVAAAVIVILNEIPKLDTHQCVIVGKGETAGKPIAQTLRKRGWTVEVVHSQTENPAEIIKKSRVVISCVGKGKVITKDMVHKDTILIGVGRRDYDEDEIKNIVAYYTPTPGGVGPVNVACLMQNLVKACTINAGGSA